MPSCRRDQHQHQQRYSSSQQKPILGGQKKMKMDFLFSNYCYKNVEDISQLPSGSKHKTDAISYLKESSAQVNDDQSLPDEDDYMEFWLQNYQSYYENDKRKQVVSFENNGSERKHRNELDEVLTHVPRLPSCIREIEGKKMNYFMIATKTDECKVIENLEKTFDKTNFRAFPLSFEVQRVEDIFHGKY